MNPDEVAALIVETSREPCKATSDRAETHELLKRIIADLAAEFGLRAASEYPVRKPDGGVGYVDVVWLSGSEPMAAFEIDSSRRKKSLRKLLAVSTAYRFWIYYGQKDPTAFVESFDTGGCIRLVCTHLGPRQPVGANAKAASTDGAGTQTRALFSAEEHIRQAIKDCWHALPEEERSLRRVEAEVLTLMRRALHSADQALPSSCRSDSSRQDCPSTGNTYAVARATHPRAYERWTEEEDKQLRREFMSGVSVLGLSRRHQRRPSAILSRLRKQGLL